MDRAPASFQSEPLIIRQRWMSRLLPISALVVVAGNSLRIAEKIHVPLIWYVLVAANVGFLIFLFRSNQQATQRLYLDGTGLTLRCGKVVSQCQWRDISAFYLQSFVSGRKRGPQEIVIKRASGPDFKLNTSWAIPCDQLIALTMQKCQTVTGQSPQIGGLQVETAKTRRTLKFFLALIVLGATLKVAAAVLRHHSEASLPALGNLDRKVQSDGVTVRLGRLGP
jgi:hypothetical protein